MVKFRFESLSQVGVIEFTLNGERQTIASGTTIGELVETLDLKGKRFAIERNGELVPKTEHAQAKLQAGDRVEIVVAVGGG